MQEEEKRKDCCIVTSTPLNVSVRFQEQRSTRCCFDSSLFDMHLLKSQKVERCLGNAYNNLVYIDAKPHSFCLSYYCGHS